MLNYSELATDAGAQGPAPGRLVSHQLADAFPLMNGGAFKELVASIKENGLREPITLFEGAILDGRNRYRACLEAGVEPRTEDFDGDNPEMFVVMKNMHRRHLTSSQKAMLVEKFATLSKGFKGGECSPYSLQTVADQAGIDRSQIAYAKVVANEGAPQEIEAVKSGEIGVRAAAKKIMRRRPSDNKPAQKTIRKQKIATARFERSIHHIVDTCEQAIELKIPDCLTDDDFMKAAEEISAAQRNLALLRRRLERKEK